MADPTVIIDLSAIAYPNDIPGVRDKRPEWQRVEAAVKAWRQENAKAVFFGVVDKRTWHRPAAAHRLEAPGDGPLRLLC